MKNIPIGLELYSVREAFAENPENTLKKVANLGYACVEFCNDTLDLFEAERLNDALAAAGLYCCGYLTSWSDMQTDNYARMLRYNEKLHNPYIAIGSAPVAMLRSREGVKKVIAHMNAMHSIAGNEGFRFGYHNHETDFVMVDGVSAWDRIMDAMPEDFLMVLDTGNALAGGAQSVPILQRHPGRSPWVHVKPYSETLEGYDTMIGEDSFDWPKLLDACIRLGGARILTVEYGRRRKYEPFYGAKLCIEGLKANLALIEN